MPLNFSPNDIITNSIANNLLKIEGVKQRFVNLPITPGVLAGLRESARLHATYYSTMIEVNRLTQKDVNDVINYNKHIPEREKDLIS